MRDGLESPYIGNLLYAAIFSDKLIYDCNVARLLYRTGVLAEGFGLKVNLMDGRGCDSNLNADLFAWGSSVTNATVNELISLHPAAKAMDKKNSLELCGVW